jgi:nucleotide-binding universal stress UspA family protein
MMTRQDQDDGRIVVGVDGSSSSIADVAMDFEGDAEKILAGALNAITDRDPDVVIHPVVEAHAAEALVRAARGAALLVVGSRGRGGFAGALLGSVSQYCVHHAPCPVLVIRETCLPVARS